MSAFFFGSSAQPLFGYHHAPSGRGTGAVVLCSSWGSEYSYAHRALRVLAKRLAEHGCHVLRFDYSGQGDSWGETTDADVDRWITDTASAVEELRAISGEARVDIVGLRIGALAAAACANDAGVRRVVLWDPVLDGRAWARQVSPALSVKTLDHVSAPCEFGNRVVSATLVRQLVAIGPERYATSGAETLLLQSQSSGSTRALELESIATTLEHRVVDDALPWREDSSIWSGLVPTRAIAIIVDWLGRA